MVVQGKLAASLEALLLVEKQSRIAEDMACSKDACAAIMEVVHTHGDWKLLLEHVILLTKRRGQLKASIQVRIDIADVYVCMHVQLSLAIPNPRCPGKSFGISRGLVYQGFRHQVTPFDISRGLVYQGFGIARDNCISVFLIGLHLHSETE